MHGVEAEMNAAWQQREGARRHLHAEPHNSNLRKAMIIAETNLRKVRKAAVVRCTSRTVTYAKELTLVYMCYITGEWF